MKRLIEVLRVIVLVVMAGYDEYTFNYIRSSYFFDINKSFITFIIRQCS